MRKVLGKGNHSWPADQCRAWGLKIGDTILGRENYNDPRYNAIIWSEIKLNLKFLGESVCVWNVTRRDSRNMEWIKTGESANWSLAHRNWELVEDNES